MASNLFKTNVKQTTEIRKIPLKFDISMLNKLIGYLFKDGTYVTRKALTNMKKLFEIIDDEVYMGSNEDLETRYFFIKRALKARLDLGLEDNDLIINYCKTDNSNSHIETIVENLEAYSRLNYEEINFINKAIQDRLQYYYVLEYKDKIYNLVERLDTGEYESFQEINEEFENLCVKFNNQARKVRVLNDTDTFSLTDAFEVTTTDIVNKLRDPSRILKTGIQLLNQILAPGYLSKRLYIYMGLPAGFKSGILLKSALDIKKYNKGIRVRKPGKRPVVTVITMENTVEESVERIFNMSVTPDDIRNYSPQDVIQMLREKGELTIADDSDIDIVIKYYPNRSINTSDLYTIIDELSDDNRETIALVFDYIKRIKPAEYAKDEKEELKNVTNELKQLAIDYDIPVITAHQLNRAGAAAVDAAMTANKEDLTRFVGRSNVGSAWEVQENADWCCIINVEKKKANNQYYLTFKRIKIRYRDPNDLGYFNHPFDKGNRMKLLDDFYLEKSLSEESLATDFEGVELPTKKGKRNAVEREIIDDDDDDIFDFNSSINKKK